MTPGHPAVRGMGRRVAAGALTVFAATLSSAAGGGGPPLWAYPPNPNGLPLPPGDDGALMQVPGSTAVFTLSQTRDEFDLADWHPDDHPPMPDIVVHGRRPTTAVKSG